MSKKIVFVKVSSKTRDKIMRAKYENKCKSADEVINRSLNVRREYSPDMNKDKKKKGRKFFDF